eukprot:scaffold135147_cov28-Tisochrysis_lutea.AAC.1
MRRLVARSLVKWLQLLLAPPLPAQARCVSSESKYPGSRRLTGLISSKTRTSLLVSRIPRRMLPNAASQWMRKDATLTSSTVVRPTLGADEWDAARLSSPS